MPCTPRRGRFLIEVRSGEDDLTGFAPPLYTRDMRMRSPILLLALILALVVAAGAAAAPILAQEGATPTPTPTPARSPAEVDALVQDIIERMTVEQRVGQLFLVTFVGNDTGPNSDIAQLVRDWHVGGRGAADRPTKTSAMKAIRPPRCSTYQ